MAAAFDTNANYAGNLALAHWAVDSTASSQTRRSELESDPMTSQNEPDRSVGSFSYLKREDGSWNLLVIAGGALGAIFVGLLIL
jgi:hypothetical protein